MALSVRDTYGNSISIGKTMHSDKPLANLARAVVTNTCGIHCRKMAATDGLCELVCRGYE
jgi:hypothetical protein